MNVQGLNTNIDAAKLARNDRYVIFAANKFPANYVSAFLDMRGIYNRKAVGMYEGIAENSWLIKLNDLDLIQHLLKGERTILELDRDHGDSLRHAVLVWLIDNDGHFKGERLQLGKLTEIGEADLKGLQGHTTMWSFNSQQEFVASYWTCYQYDIFGHPIKD